jgi:hypothetical protein
MNGRSYRQETFDGVEAVTDGYKAALNVNLIGSDNNQPYTMLYDTVK